MRALGAGWLWVCAAACGVAGPPPDGGSADAVQDLGPAPTDAQVGDAERPDVGPAEVRDAEVSIDVSRPDGGVPNRDPVTFVGLPEGRLHAVAETVEVRHEGRRVGTCSGLRSFELFEFRPGRPLQFVRQIAPTVDGRAQIRCQHFDFIGADRAVVAHHGDIIMEQPWLALVELSTGRTLHVLELAASAEGVEVVGDHAYVALHQGGLGIYRVERDQLISLGSVVEGLGNAWTPRADSRGEHLYVADADRGLAVFDLALPSSPRWLATLPSEGTAKDVAIRDQVAYVAAGVAGIEVVDVSEPNKPELLARVDTEGSALGIATSTQALLVADWTRALLFERVTPRDLRFVATQKAFGTLPTPDLNTQVFDVELVGSDAIFGEWDGLESHRTDVRGAAPDMVVPSAVALPRERPDDPALIGVRVHNRGARPLVVDRIVAPAPLIVMPSQLEIQPESAQLISIALPSGAGEPFDGFVSLLSNDIDEPQLEIRVRANGGGLLPGDAVPDLEFVTLDGDARQLSQFRGSPVLLAYFATF